jgi:phospholipase/carboxylesterase
MGGFRTGWEDGSMSDTPRIDPDLVVWRTAPDEPPGRPLLVLLHGYGADERDLLALAELLPDGFDVAAVRAPLTPPWPSPGYSWYPIEGLGGRDPSAVTAAATGVLDWLDAAEASPRVGLLGFSQGAAVALQALRLAPERFGFVVNLSGYVTPGTLPGDAALAERKPPVFWGRGTHDDVIPEPLLAHTVEWLPAHAELSGRVYPGLTHSVSEQELADVSAFLTKRLDDPVA